MKGNPLVSSKLLDRRWKTRDLQIHKQRLRSVKSSISAQQSAPMIPNCILRNAKKEEMNERRYTEIEKANRILLERMTHIMQTGGRHNNNFTPMTSHVPKRSLNSEVRRKELMKITIENQAILKRLQDKTSNYSV